jgi:GNAT superfamily N-acetyltransferase
MRATLRDVEKIAPLFDDYRAFFAEAGDGQARSFLNERLAREEAVIFAAWLDGDAAGFITLYPLWSSWYCRRIWFLSDLYVAPAARKLGIGASLVRRVAEYAKETEAASVMVELPRSEPHLAEFYAKLGFARDKVFELARYC